jgi:predicted transcriptional regulator
MSNTNLEINYDLDSKLHPYLKDMISNLPNGSKLVMQALSKKDYNKEDLSLKAGVRRGELNFVLNWIEALGFVLFTTSGRQKLYKLTPLGITVFEEFKPIFHELKEDNRE